MAPRTQATTQTATRVSKKTLLFEARKFMASEGSRNPPIPKIPVSSWRVYAIGFSVGAGFIHLMAAPEHFALWWGYGLFFLVAATAQIAYGVMLALDEPSIRWLKAGLVGNSLIIGLYLVSRTVGIPLVGPARGVVEPIGWVDLTSKAAELGLLVSLVMMYRARRPSIQHEHPNALRPSGKSDCIGPR